VPKLSGTPGRIVASGPELGEHNGEVFQRILGLGEADIATLLAKKVIGNGKRGAAVAAG
jgi:formyl-CoA transferase